MLTHLGAASLPPSSLGQRAFGAAQSRLQQLIVSPNNVVLASCTLPILCVCVCGGDDVCASAAGRRPLRQLLHAHAGTAVTLNIAIRADFRAKRLMRHSGNMSPMFSISPGEV